MKLNYTIKETKNKAVKFIFETTIVVTTSFFLSKLLLSSKQDDKPISKSNKKSAENISNKNAIKNLKFIESRKKIKEYLSSIKK
ncbi:MULTISPECIES: hypothetical protein [Clostridium]|uniref:hypothetical protein n=1 Tax=Clostridium TaxID=1485 RepID=UPI000826AA90|nr:MULTISPECIES: hypothetical protein [Clostridium]PJI06745.1 hypothetical protein CUB90_02175 [Clostridium sp. CT7]